MSNTLLHSLIQEAIDELTNTELGGHLTNIHSNGLMIVSTVVDSFRYQGLTFPRGSTFTIDAGLVLDYTGSKR